MIKQLLFSWVGICVSFLHLCFLVGFLSISYGGDVFYREFVLKKKAFLIGDIEELPDEEGIAFQRPKKR